MSVIAPNARYDKFISYPPFLMLELSSLEVSLLSPQPGVLSEDPVWCPPPPSFLKINCDAAFRGSKAAFCVCC